MTPLEAPVELAALFGTTVVLFLSIVAQGIAFDLRAGIAYALSGRDGPQPNRAPVNGRLERNVRNQMEGLAMFLPLVVIGGMLGISNDWTQTASVVFAVARALYAIAYAFDLVPWRSIAWFVGIGATIAFVGGLA